MKKRFSRRSSRRKGERKVTSGFYRYPAPIVIPLNQAIRVQMRNLITVTSSVGGIISGMIPCDPSAVLAAPFAAGAMFNEWSSWAALFSAIKCVQLECTFMPSSSDEVKGDASIGVAIAGNLTSIANFATSYLAAMDNGDSHHWNPVLDTSGRGIYHSIRHRPSLNWGGTSTPASSSAVYAGAVGGIGMYASTAVSLNLFTIRVVGTYLLSNRS
jgi:hypothetical protein